MTGLSVEVPAGLIDPIQTTPPRQAGSVRRTSHIDIEPSTAGGLVLTGAARDLRTHQGHPRVIAAAQVRAELDARLHLVALTTSPADPRAARLVGRAVAGGFRSAAEEAMPEARRESSPLFVLLDDLPVAALISGYARLYSGAIGLQQADAGHVKADVCAGWRSEGTMMVSLRATRRMPVPVGPPATRLEPATDPWAWHEIGPLAPGAMRRRRLVDVSEGDPAAVYAMFRDTHADASNTETVLHEYSVTADLDPTTLILSRCRAQPRVLPWVECPEAVASATRLDGRLASDVRRLVARELRGTSTCTHLNDLLRSLGDLGALAALLQEA